MGSITNITSCIVWRSQLPNNLIMKIYPNRIDQWSNQSYTCTLAKIKQSHAQPCSHYAMVAVNAQLLYWSYQSLGKSGVLRVLQSIHTFALECVDPSGLTDPHSLWMGWRHPLSNWIVAPLGSLALCFMLRLWQELKNVQLFVRQCMCPPIKLPFMHNWQHRR